MPAFMDSFAGPTAAEDCAKAGCYALTSRQARGFFQGCGYDLPSEQHTDEEEEDQAMALCLMAFMLLRHGRQ